MSLHIKDRIKEFRRVPASKLRPNPSNWRTHPIEQLDAIRGIFAEVGYVTPIIVRELEDGFYEIIDGHARTEVSGDSEIPCVVLDVTAEEAKKILATFDPIGDLAGKDAEKLNQLLADIEFENPAVNNMLDELIAEEEKEDDQNEGDAGESKIKEQFQILVICQDESEQAELLEEFSAKGLNCRSLIS